MKGNKYVEFFGATQLHVISARYIFAKDIDVNFEIHPQFIRIYCGLKTDFTYPTTMLNIT